MMQADPGSHILDVGCGTGHFSRRFTQAGHRVTGVDPNNAWLDYARELNHRITYQQADARSIPFESSSVDYAVAVTSLCFIPEPTKAVSEMWRVSREGVFLGLLNRKSILYYQKNGRGAYQGARWDSRTDVNSWLRQLRLKPETVKYRTAILLPDGSIFDQSVETLLSALLPWGGFLGVFIKK